VGRGVDFIEGLAVQPTRGILCQLKLAVNAQFVSALMIKCNPTLASTPIASADEDMFVASLRFPIWSYNGNVAVLLYWSNPVSQVLRAMAFKRTTRGRSNFGELMTVKIS
jgi:hypothetical protein